jgi:hypothetical protein
MGSRSSSSLWCRQAMRRRYLWMMRSMAIRRDVQALFWSPKDSPRSREHPMLESPRLHLLKQASTRWE